MTTNLVITPVRIYFYILIKYIMEDTCPNFNVDSALEETLIKMPGISELLNELKEDKSVFSDECPILQSSSVGGKRRMNRSHSSKKGKVIR